MASDEFVSIKQLAKRLGMECSDARHYVLELGYVPGRRRIEDRWGRLTLCVTREEAEKIVSQHANGASIDPTVVPVSSFGVFYVIQMVPELDPKLLKLGCCGDIEQRLSQYRITTPTARVLRIWPCKRSWEQAATAALTRVDCRLMLNQVFECNDQNSLLERGDAFFSMLPPPHFQVPFSEASPLNELASNLVHKYPVVRSA